MGSGSYAKKATVTVTANPAPTGQRFYLWQTSSPNVSVASATTSPTTFTMPDNNVVITATYHEAETGTAATTTTGTTTGTTSSGDKDATTGTTGGTSGGNVKKVAATTGGTSTASADGTKVSITKPGISNTDVASASVDGATDNFVVKITESSAAEDAVKKALKKEYGDKFDNIRYSAMDISLYDSTGATKIKDTSNISVNITMPIPDDLVKYAGNNKAAGVVESDTLDKLDASTKFTTIDNVPCISFTATHFSPYTVYVDTANLTEAMDNSPKTGDPISPKWFFVIAFASMSVALFLKKDKGEGIRITEKISKRSEGDKK